MPLGNNICETTMTPSKQCADLFPQRLCIILNFEGSHLRSGCVQGHIYICASLHYKVAARFHLFTVHMRSLGAICASLENHHGGMSNTYSNHFRTPAMFHSARFGCAWSGVMASCCESTCALVPYDLEHLEMSECAACQNCVIKAKRVFLTRPPT